MFTVSQLFGGGAAANYERAQSLMQRAGGKVFRENVSPHWLPDKKHFWYQVQTGLDVREYVRVDSSTGEIKRAATAEKLGLPDHGRVSTSSQRSLKPRRSSSSNEQTTIRMMNTTAAAVEVFWVDERGVRKSYGQLNAGESKEFLTYTGHVWLVVDSDGKPFGFFEATPLLEVAIDGMPDRPARSESRDSAKSPDGKHSVLIENNNVVLVSASGEKTVLTTDGTDARPYVASVNWAADSQHGVVLSVRKVPPRIVTVVESSPRDQLQPKVRNQDYIKPGDDLPSVQPVLIDIKTKTARKIPNDLFPNAFTTRAELTIRWSPRGDEFYFDYNQRGHQLYRIIAVNAHTAAVRTVVEESSATFIDYQTKTWREWLPDTGELLWMSERDGWAHLWLYDVASGKVKNAVTHGQWVVREVVKVDPVKRQLWFLASGVRLGEDPYDRQLCRVNFDGTGMAQLTQGNGDHTVEFSPDGSCFVASWSRVDQAPVTELRRSDDGKMICELERADISQLLKAGWTLPERFVAKGRDSKTDIHGIIIKPSNFDPNRRYPVVEEVYAGPHDSFAAHRFELLLRHHQLAELGFIVVQSDGMGTNNRGKAFHNYSWKNLQDAGFPDRIAWIKSAAQTRSWMDLSRVGIYGGSAGGQSAMRALLDYSDFYRVAVADCGCHDNRMDKIWWNEQWLGWPLDESYVRSSNVVDAHKLQGKLMLIVGELDSNVDPASTMQVVNALQKADKDFDFVVIAGADHGAAETPYGKKRRMDFLVRNLMTVEPKTN